MSGVIAYREVFEAHEGNVSDKWDNYLDIYHETCQKFIAKRANVLEIGVQNGGSLQVLSKYLIDATIHGVDIVPAVANLDLGSNIKTYSFDINDEVKFKSSFGDMNFDIIIDDASHISADVIASFKMLFCKLNPGGVYIAEDMHASYWGGSFAGGYLNENSSIEFFKRFIDLLNTYNIQITNFIKSLKGEKFDINLPEDEMYTLNWMESITFYDSVVVIKKLSMPRSGAYKRRIVGKYSPVASIRHSI